jgi:hypothetical protein
MQHILLPLGHNQVISNKVHAQLFAERIHRACRLKSYVLLVFKSVILYLYHDCYFYWWGKPEYPKKTTDLSQVTDKVASSTPRLRDIRTQNIICDRHWMHVENTCMTPSFH